MWEVLLWAAQMVLGALLLLPFAALLGHELIDYWYKTKARFLAQQAQAQAEALKVMAEQMKNDGEQR